MERDGVTDRIRVASAIVEVSVERAAVRVVVVVATDIREIRGIDIAIVGEETQEQRATDAARSTAPPMDIGGIHDTLD